MPELPEVERGRRDAEDVAAGRRIAAACVADDALVFEGWAAPLAERELVGRRVRRVHRVGKHLWWEFDEPPHLLFHFGMTGGFATPGRPGLKLEAGPRPGPPSWPPRFWKLLLTFDDGGRLAYCDARRLGRVRFRQVPREEPPLVDLGPDALQDLPSALEFRRALSQRGGSLKATLLDQGFLAGLGNWMADEILYQARLDPRLGTRDLAPPQARRLHGCVRRVVSVAVAAVLAGRDYPADWLFHQRWGRPVGARTSRGDRVEVITVAGRSTAWVPSVQGRRSPP